MTNVLEALAVWAYIIRCPYHNWTNQDRARVTAKADKAYFFELLNGGK